MLSGHQVSKTVFFDRHLKCTAGSEYQCHSSSVFLPLGADLSCLHTIVSVLQIFFLLWHGGSVGSVTHLSGRANKRIKERKYVQNTHVNVRWSIWKKKVQPLVDYCCSDGWMDFLFQNRVRLFGGLVKMRRNNVYTAPVLDSGWLSNGTADVNVPGTW